MARPLRIEVEGGRYHVTARGNERRAIYRQDADRLHFLQLLSELPLRFGNRIHAYVLMNNHYHLIVETPEANLSRAMQWLNVSYGVWFNRRHRRSGHLLQGRFKAILIEADLGLQQVARYVHLNPVRVVELDLGKQRRQAVARGLAQAPKAEVVSRRLEILRRYRWSSYRALAGYTKAAGWLEVKRLRSLCGGRSESDQIKSVRQYTEDAVREGMTENPWEGLVAGVVLGAAEYARGLLKAAQRNLPEQGGAARRLGRVSWKEIIQAVEKLKGERWEDFHGRHGDWGRDGALWLGRRAGRMRLGELAGAMGGCDYTTVAKAVNRFGRRLEADKVLASKFERIQNEMSRF